MPGRSIRSARGDEAGGRALRWLLGHASAFSASADLARADLDPASLERLHDVILPPPVPWWPVAPGWFGLAAGVVVSIIVLLWRARRRRRRNRYRAEALAELAALQAEPLAAGPAVAQRLILLKRIALSAYPREEVASLHGPAWWRYLDERGGATRFSQGLGAACEALAYRDARERDARATEPVRSSLEALDRAVEQWIRAHRPEPSSESRPAGRGKTGRVEATEGA